MGGELGPSLSTSLDRQEGCPGEEEADSSIRAEVEQVNHTVLFRGAVAA